MPLPATTPPQEVSRALVTSSTERELLSCYPLLSMPSPAPAHALGTSSADRELLLARTGSAVEVSHKALVASGGVAWAKATEASSRPSAQSGPSRGPGDAQRYRGVTREEAVEGFRAAMQQSLHVSALAEGGDRDGAPGSACASARLLQDLDKSAREEDEGVVGDASRPSHVRQDHHMRQDHHTSVRHEALERMDEEALRTLHSMLVRHSSRSANK